jgi:hypothetical protein
VIYRQIVRINSKDVDKATLDIIQAQIETIKTQQAQMEAMDKCVLELRTALAMAEKMIIEMQDPHNIQ